MGRYGSLCRAGKVRQQTPFREKQLHHRLTGRAKQRHRYGRLLFREQRIASERRWDCRIGRQRPRLTELYTESREPGAYQRLKHVIVLRDNTTNRKRKVAYRDKIARDWSWDRHKEMRNTGPLMPWMARKHAEQWHKVFLLYGTILEDLLPSALNTKRQHQTRCRGTGENPRLCIKKKPRPISDELHVTDRTHYIPGEHRGRTMTRGFREMAQLLASSPSPAR
ncbi:hypothetical protein PAPYR_2348 [Paratrimastix pyriformis]|uniref:Uncharacterized protein n=1 Tax=Paratrimastix pyriformis TaxID=342808 RepID=A0ABQ8UR40_9EUKA|nr:hypothetical protein PAPYR_2348 [Paratrimastix pyriformis]